MAEQYLPSYEVGFNSKVQQLRDIAARFDRARRHYFNRRVQRFRDIAERFEDLTKERIRFYRIRQRLTARIERLTKKLINFAEIAESCEEVSGIVPNELARDAAYKKFQSDLFERDFEKNGRSQILYFHPNSAKVRMTPDWLKRMIETHRDQTIINSQYLAHCWVPPEYCDRFFAKHRIQPCPERFEPKRQTPSATTKLSLPPRFQAPQQSRAGISPEAEGRAPEIPIPAPMVAPQPVVKIVDQPEVPSGIEPTEVRVPTPQDGDEPRSLVQDSPLPSDECSDLNTQRNKGGRPPAVDWEALRDPLAEEIKILGFPERRNAPGWRGTKDVADWAEAKLRKEAKDVARRTIEDNMRKIIKELRASTAKPVSR